MNSITVNAPFDRVRDFILNPDIVLRLNPSWHIRDMKHTGKDLYSLTLYDERTDETSQVNLHIEMRDKAICYIMDSNMIFFSLNEIKHGKIQLSIAGDMLINDDLPYWLRGLKNYVYLETKHSRIIKLLLERFWLRMTPSQRRIAIIIIVAEGIGLIALIGVVIAFKFMKHL